MHEDLNDKVPDFSHVYLLETDIPDCVDLF